MDDQNPYRSPDAVVAEISDGAGLAERGVDLLGEAVHRRGVVDDVARVHLDRDLDVRGGCTSLDVLPEGDRHLPLVVAHVEEWAPPGQDVPGHVGAAGLGRGGAGHRDDALDAKESRELDRVDEVLGVREVVSGEERVAVAVERGERQPARGEFTEVVLTRLLARAEFCNRQVDRRQEPAGVDLDRVQAQIPDDVKGLAEWFVAEAGVVDTDVHGLPSLGFSGGWGGRWWRRHWRRSG